MLFLFEEAFSKINALLRKIGPRTREELLEALTRALLEITDGNAHGWFRHCGYELPAQEDELHVG